MPSETGDLNYGARNDLNEIKEFSQSGVQDQLDRERLKDTIRDVHKILASLSEPVISSPTFLSQTKNKPEQDNRDQVYDLIDNATLLSEDDRGRLMAKVADILRSSTPTTNVIAECSQFIRSLASITEQANGDQILQLLQPLFKQIDFHVQKHLQIKNPNTAKPLVHVEKDQAAEKIHEIDNDSHLDSLAKAINGRVFTSPDAKSFKSIIITRESLSPKEPTMRVYRAVNSLEPKNVLAEPYAMRAEDGNGGIDIVQDEQLRQAVNLLAHEPTYQNFLAYSKIAERHLTGNNLRRHRESRSNIEAAILKGIPLRNALMHDQTAHMGGRVAESGSSPYVSATYDLNEAFGYLSHAGGLIVMDIPLSQLEDISDTKTETNIKSKLEAKYITAIIPCSEAEVDDIDALEKTLHTISTISDRKSTEPEEESRLRSEKMAQRNEQDQMQLVIDQGIIQENRMATLVKRFADFPTDLAVLRAQAKAENKDIYIVVKQYIYDQLVNKLKLFNRDPSEDYSYTESETLTPEKRSYSRERVTDSMLSALNNWIERLEERRGNS